MLDISIFSIILLFSTVVAGEVHQCQSDCRQSSPFRLVGPTRPWHAKDLLGNELHLTRSYPYSIAGSAIDDIQFNLTFAVHGLNHTIMDDELSYMEVETEAFVNTVKDLLQGTNSSFDLKFFTSSENEDGNASSSKFEMVVQVDLIDQDYNHDAIDTLSGFEAALTATINGDEFNPHHQNGGYNVTRSVGISTQRNSKVLHTGEPNPYSKFCELGCSLFFSSPSDPLHINECTAKCDDFYKYNISVGYNDLAEVARLECRDGCQIGLIRCQPGYYCSQVTLRSEQSEEVIAFNGGIMAHCPAGTYRDVSYDAVEECIPCPPGRFREDVKGRSLGGCSKCPAGTYNSKNGSSTIRDCLRCPAGTFTNEPGSENCICITPSACLENQMPSPADAEKRDTVPFIGLW